MKDARVPAANQLSFSPERLEAIRERFDTDVAAMKSQAPRSSSAIVKS
jgi:hypothetical protein